MRDLTRHAGYIVLLGFLSLSGWTVVAPSPPPPSQVVTGRSADVRLNEGYGHLPLGFEANRGQTDPRVDFIARGKGYSLFLTNNEAVLALKPRNRQANESAPRGGTGLGVSRRAKTEFHANTAAQSADASLDVVRIKLLEANPSPEVKGLSELPGESNYFIGADPQNWLTGISSYTKVLYRDVYPGIDLMYYSRRGQLEYDFIVAPGADPGAVELLFDGVESLRVDDHGDLVLQTTNGELRQKRPLIYQEEGGVKQYLPGGYEVRDAQRVGFQVAAHDPDRPLIVDPVLIYSTYVGGVGFEQNRGIAVDGEGSAYIIGETDSVDFPTASPLQAALAGGRDAFVTKLNAAGSSIVYSTYFGGSDDDDAREIAVDGSGNAYIVGDTESVDFPTMNPFQDTYAGGSSDGFLAKLNAGGAMSYSTYLGGSGLDRPSGVAVDVSGNAHVVGRTDSTDFPTANAFQETYAGGTFDGFLAKVNGTGTAVVYSTYIGGSGEDWANDVALDSEGSPHIAGFTESADFPTTALAFQPVAPDVDNGFVAKFDGTGTFLNYSTYLGGSGFDASIDIAIDSLGNPYVAGNTQSSDFPQVSLQAVRGGGQDVFVAKLNAQGSAIAYATYLGGSDREAANDIDVDSSGNAYVTGLTESSNFPTANPLQSAFGGEWDAFVTQINAEGSALTYSTYLGGSGRELATGIRVDSMENAHVSGTTGSIDFPKVSALQPAYGGGTADVFVVKIGEIGPKFSQAGLVNSASFVAGPLAPDSWADLFGENLATQFVLDPSFPTSLDGTSVTITDSQGAVHQARLHFVDPNRIQFLVPPGMAAGPATLTVTNSTGDSTTVDIQIATVAPGLFSANASGQGPAAATFLRVAGDGTRTQDFTFTLAVPRVNAPIDLGPANDQVFLSFFGTGFRFQTAVGAQIGGIDVPVFGAVAQGQFEALDQAVVGPLPRSLAGIGEADVVFFFDGIQANTVTVNIR